MGEANQLSNVGVFSERPSDTETGSARNNTLISEVLDLREPPREGGSAFQGAALGAIRTRDGEKKKDKNKKKVCILSEKLHSALGAS